MRQRLFCSGSRSSWCKMKSCLRFLRPRSPLGLDPAVRTRNRQKSKHAGDEKPFRFEYSHLALRLVKTSGWLLVTHVRAPIEPVDKTVLFQIVDKTKIEELLRLGFRRFWIPGCLD